MAYPITASQTVDAQQAMTLAFRPALAGLVNVVVKASAIIPPPPPPHSGENDPPPPAVLALRLDVLAPGIATPVFTRSQRLQIKGTTPDRMLVFGDIPAAANQLAADWTVKVTNLSNLRESFEVIVRYQTVEGNLGKVDHILVLMMENRSFDHMLGYLKLAGRSDIDGLGTQFNFDDHNVPQPVTRRTDTNFITDPGHGWTDVAGALPGSTSPPTVPYQLSGDSAAGLASNAGFVHNFTHQISVSNPQPPHDFSTLQPGASHSFQFRPNAIQPGKTSTVIGARSVPLTTPTQSSSGNLGELALFPPGATTPSATGTALIGSGAVSVGQTLQAADLAKPGNWTCRLTNNSDSLLDFISDVSNSMGATGPGDEEPPAAIMGYYDRNGVPVYDALASQFAVCDRWFASIPTDTFPNRLYAMSGGSGGLLTTPSDASVATNPPAFTMKTIFEVLQENGVDWNVFFSDLPFALVFKALARDAQYTSRMRPMDELLRRAATGDLPAMAWIDPNFNDVPDGTDNATDDHPPGDVSRGQQFIARLFNALATGPAWSKTLLVITYDEHGGFYDHVQPPGTPLANGSPLPGGPKDDDPNLTRYGVRVPAIVVSPWVAHGQAAHTVYDHTSILRTILLRYCKQPLKADPGTGLATDGAVTPRVVVIGGGVGLPSTVPSMGARTDSANDLGPLLSLDAPRAATPIGGATLAALAPHPVTHSAVRGIGATIRRGLLGF
jgi:phospholipase C